MIREVIEWHDVGEQMPDDEITVLLHVPSIDEPVWLGWHANGIWFLSDGSDLDDREKVERWASVPTGEASQ